MDNKAKVTIAETINHLLESRSFILLFQEEQDDANKACVVSNVEESEVKQAILALAKEFEGIQNVH